MIYNLYERDKISRWEHAGDRLLLLKFDIAGRILALDYVKPGQDDPLDAISRAQYSHGISFEEAGSIMAYYHPDSLRPAYDFGDPSDIVLKFPSYKYKQVGRGSEWVEEFFDTYKLSLANEDVGDVVKGSGREVDILSAADGYISAVIKTGHQKLLRYFVNARDLARDKSPLYAANMRLVEVLV